MHPRRPHSIRQVQDMGRVDHEEAQVPGEDVGRADIQGRPQREQEDPDAQDRSHHQRRQPEVVRD